MRSVHQIYEFLHGQREEARKHRSDYDIGRESALSSVLDLIARIDEIDIPKLHEVVKRLAPLLLLMPVWWI